VLHLRVSYLHIVVDRDLGVKRKFDNHPILWQILLLICEGKELYVGTRIRASVLLPIPA